MRQAKFHFHFFCLFITLIFALVVLLTLTFQSRAPLNQFTIISSAASQDGVAAAASEEAKYNQYLDIVNKSGGLLFMNLLISGHHHLHCQP